MNVEHEFYQRIKYPAIAFTQLCRLAFGFLKTRMSCFTEDLDGQSELGKSIRYPFSIVSMKVGPNVSLKNAVK
jgi:heterodisulfide reductase subunit B